MNLSKKKRARNARFLFSYLGRYDLEFTVNKITGYKLFRHALRYQDLQSQHLQKRVSR